MDKLRVLGFHYEFERKAAENKPKVGGKLFIIQGKSDEFQSTWPLSEETDV